MHLLTYHVTQYLEWEAVSVDGPKSDGKKNILPAICDKARSFLRPIDCYIAAQRAPRLFCFELAAPAPAMASVYKSVSKKKARSSAEDVNGEDVFMQDVADDSSDSEEEEEEVEDGNGSGEQSTKQNSAISAGLMPKTRVLMLTSRGVTHR